MSTEAQLLAPRTGALRKPALRRLIAQYIAQRYQGHALMVGHVVFNDAEVFAMRLVCGGKVNRVHETEFTPRVQQLQAPQVGSAGSKNANVLVLD